MTHTLRRSQIATLCFAVILFAPGPHAGEADTELKAVTPVDPPPQLAFVKGNGETGTLEMFRGKTVVLNIWATWCSPCVKELPSLDRLSKILDKKKFAVVLLSQDADGAAAVKPFLEKLKISNLTSLYDPDSQASEVFGIRGVPMTIILDPSGRVVAKAEGPAEWDSRHMVDEIARLPSAEKSPPIGSK